MIAADAICREPNPSNEPSPMPIVVISTGTVMTVYGASVLLLAAGSQPAAPLFIVAATGAYLLTAVVVGRFSLAHGVRTEPVPRHPFLPGVAIRWAGITSAVVGFGLALLVPNVLTGALSASAGVVVLLLAPIITR
jgi:hypothetical protein